MNIIKRLTTIELRQPFPYLFYLNSATYMKEDRLNKRKSKVVTHNCTDTMRNDVLKTAIRFYQQKQ